MEIADVVEAFVLAGANVLYVLYVLCALALLVLSVAAAFEGMWRAGVWLVRWVR